MGGTMDQLTPGQTLAKAVKLRRDELGRSQDDVMFVVKTAGLRLSIQSIRNIEKGERDHYYDTTLDALDVGLDWPKGTAQGILEGKDETVDRPLSEHLDLAKAAHLDRLALVAVPASKMTDAEALLVVLRCLSDDQFGMVARAVQADDRFASL